MVGDRIVVPRPGERHALAHPRASQQAFRAGDLLEEQDGVLHGVLENWTQLSIELGHPIRA
jgi:hypothetical protein